MSAWSWLWGIRASRMRAGILRHQRLHGTWPLNPKQIPTSTYANRSNSHLQLFLFICTITKSWTLSFVHFISCLSCYRSPIASRSLQLEPKSQYRKPIAEQIRPTTAIHVAILCRRRKVVETTGNRPPFALAQRRREQSTQPTCR